MIDLPVQHYFLLNTISRSISLLFTSVFRSISHVEDAFRSIVPALLWNRWLINVIKHRKAGLIRLRGNFAGRIRMNVKSLEKKFSFIFPLKHLLAGPNSAELWTIVEISASCVI